MKEKLSISIDKELVDKMQKLVDIGLFPSKSAIAETSIRLFLQSVLILFESIQEVGSSDILAIIKVSIEKLQKRMALPPVDISRLNLVEYEGLTKEIIEVLKK